jgi:hypothetical protein
MHMDFTVTKKSRLRMDNETSILHSGTVTVNSALPLAEAYIPLTASPKSGTGDLINWHSPTLMYGGLIQTKLPLPQST